MASNMLVSLSTECDYKSVYFLLRSVAGSSSSFFIYLNFNKCSSLRESASVSIDYLISHFSVYQPNALRSRARGYLSELQRSRSHEKSHSSFYSPFSPTKILSAATNLFSSGCNWPSQSRLFHAEAPSSLWHGFSSLHFQYFWSLHSFSFIWKTPYTIPIHKMIKSFDSPASFRPISLASGVSKVFKSIILSRLLFFLESNFILIPLSRFPLRTIYSRTNSLYLSAHFG